MEGNQVPTSLPTIRLEITLYPDGICNVSGPIPNKALCYSMLELARDAVKDFNNKKSE